MLPFFLLLLTTAGADDLAALRRLSVAVGGRTLTWNFSAPSPCSFSGVLCDSSGAVAELRLPGAGLSGQLPAATLSNLTSLRRLSLRRNSLSGQIPADLPPLLDSLFLQENSLSGEIPAALSSLSALQRLVLSDNRLSGGISPELNRLRQLRTLKLQNNNLSGSVPQLDNLTSLREFNVSYNNLVGPVPTILQKFNASSFLNTSLCGPPLGPCDSNGNNGSNLSSGAIAGIVIGSVIGLILILVFLFILWRKYRFSTSARSTQPRADTSPSPAIPEIIIEKKDSKSSENGVSNYNGNDGMVIFEKRGFRFGLEDLLRASAEVLGKGTIGSSYRAYLEGGAEVVVKRLHNVCVEEREFRERMEVVGRVRHENLVGVKCYFFGKEEKLVVYESFPIGSLATLLHGYKESGIAPMNWEARVKIACKAARGICYLHSKGPTFSHGNLKSSNILLTDTYNARISEFFINQLVSSTSTHSPSGYRAPEVLDTRTISQNADVYSFGVVLLELLTGKDPDQSGLDLPRWVRTQFKEKGAFLFDNELVRYQNKKKEDMVKVLQLGLECSLVHPDKRPVMTEVANRIEELCR